MNKSEYQKTIGRVLRPTLEELGFQKIKLNNLIKPEVLYRKDNLWFGTSWDWRDQYLEINLGQLFWFEDVIPRVIILGDYSAYTNEINKISSSSNNYLEKVASKISSTLPKAIETYHEKYDQILSGELQKKSRRSVEFERKLGKKVSDQSLKKYWV